MCATDVPARTNCDGMYASMRCTGNENGPAVNDGLRLPSYSNFDSISCRERMDAGSRGGPSVNVLARNTGKKDAKGRSMVCHTPASVSKLLNERCVQYIY